MLRFFRKNAALIGWVIVGFFGITMLSGTFLLRGLFRSQRSTEQTRYVDPSNEIAVVGMIPVDKKKFYEFLSQSYLRIYSNGQTRKLDPELREIVQFDAFTRALHYTLLRQGALDKKLKADRKDIERALQSIYIQFDIKGNKELKELLKEKNYPYKVFLKELELDSIVQKFQDLLRSQVSVTDKDVENKYSEINIRHILIKFDPLSSESQDLALKKSQEIADEISAGLAFGKAATTYSEDMDTKEKGGVLGWLSTGQSVQVFESVAFALDKGEISSPVKTPIGYHLINVTDKRLKEKPKDFDIEKEKQAILKEKQNRVISDYIQGIVSAAGLTISDPHLRAYSEKIKGNYEEAQYAYQEQISKNPSSPEPHYLLAKVYLMLNEKEKAELELSRANIKSEMNAVLDFPSFHVLYAELLKEDKAYDEMRIQYDKAIESAGDDKRVYEVLKTIFTKSKDTKRLNKVKEELARIKTMETEAAQKAAEQSAADQTDQKSNLLEEK
ncbi:peptidylprolyl isomerase [Thermoproteota archaeon]